MESLSSEDRDFLFENGIKNNCNDGSDVYWRTPRELELFHMLNLPDMIEMSGRGKEIIFEHDEKKKQHDEIASRQEMDGISISDLMKGVKDGTYEISTTPPDMPSAGQMFGVIGSSVVSELTTIGEKMVAEFESQPPQKSDDFPAGGYDCNY